ncbi:MAG: phosphate-starvation-inducible PsiE family protein [Rubrobacter sp.]
MERDPKKAFVNILEALESIAYLLIAFALSVPVAMLMVSAAMSMLEVTEAGVLPTALAVLDSVLLAFIFVELIDTIRIVSTASARGIFIAERFLLVGLVAVLRSILLLTVNLKQVQSMEQVWILLIELGVLSVLVAVLTSTLYFAHRMRLSEKKLETAD